MKPLSQHVVYLRANDVASDTRAKKMALTLSRIGLRVTVLCATHEDEPSVSHLRDVAIHRIPLKPRYSDALGVLRRQHRTWHPRLQPTRYEETYVRYKDRLHRNRAEALRGRAKRDPSRSGFEDRIKLGWQRRQLRFWERLLDLRREWEPRLEESLRSLWERIDEWTRSTSSGRWQRDWVRVREIELRFADEILNLEPDVIHAHDLTMLQVAVDAADRLRARGREVPVVYDAIENWAGLPPEDCGSPRMHRAFMTLEEEYAPLADAVITVSDPIADFLADRYRLATRPTVALNVPVNRARKDRPTVRDVAGLPRDIPLLVYAGIVTGARGLDFLVTALAHLPGVHLAIAPVPWPSQAALELEKVAAQAGVADRFHIVEPVDPEDVISFLSGADIGVHPLSTDAANHNMSIGNKLFEFAHAGLRVVVSDARAMAELVRRYRLGEVFRYGDADDLARAVRAVIDPARDAYIERDELERWKESFSWQSQEPKIAELYGALLQEDVSIEDDPFPSLEEARASAQ